MQVNIPLRPRTPEGLPVVGDRVLTCYLHMREDAGITITTQDLSTGSIRENPSAAGYINEFIKTQPHLEEPLLETLVGMYELLRMQSNINLYRLGRHHANKRTTRDGMPIITLETLLRAPRETEKHITPEMIREEYETIRQENPLIIQFFEEYVLPPYEGLRDDEEDFPMMRIAIVGLYQFLKRQSEANELEKTLERS